jgi:hypothetical protein
MIDSSQVVKSQLAKQGVESLKIVPARRTRGKESAERRLELKSHFDFDPRCAKVRHVMPSISARLALRQPVVPTRRGWDGAWIAPRSNDSAQRWPPRADTAPARPLAGAGRHVLYLDLDGVLHPEDVVRTRGAGIQVRSPPGHALFEHAPILERLLAATDWLIVLSTSWVRVLGFDATCARVPVTLRERVVGATYHRALRSTWMMQTRDQQVRSDVTRRQPAQWIALDDWPSWAGCDKHVVVTDGIKGLGDPVTQERLRALVMSSVEPSFLHLQGTEDASSDMQPIFDAVYPNAR